MGRWILSTAGPRCICRGRCRGFDRSSRCRSSQVSLSRCFDCFTSSRYFDCFIAGKTTSTQIYFIFQILLILQKWRIASKLPATMFASFFFNACCLGWRTWSCWLPGWWQLTEPCNWIDLTVYVILAFRSPYHRFPTSCTTRTLESRAARTDPAPRRLRKWFWTISSTSRPRWV